MTVDRYVFQSPYSNQFQIGRPDPSAASKEETSSVSTEILKGPDQVQQQAPTFQNTQVEKTTEVQPTNNSNQLLNLYA
jgi:hypothetical protein